MWMVKVTCAGDKRHVYARTSIFSCASSHFHMAALLASERRVESRANVFSAPPPPPVVTSSGSPSRPHASSGAPFPVSRLAKKARDSSGVCTSTGGAELSAGGSF